MSPPPVLPRPLLLSLCFLFLSCLPVVVAVSTSVTIASQLVKFDFAVPLSSGFILYWSVDPSQSSITVALSGENDDANGWIGIGFSQHGAMVPSLAVIGWSGGAAGTHVGAYSLNGYSPALVTPSSALPINGTAVQSSNGVVTILFVRPLIVAGAAAYASIDPLALCNIVYAAGSAPQSSSILPQHNTPTGFMFSVNFSSGAVDADTTDRQTLISAHAACMTITFGLILPIAMMIARFFKPLAATANAWFHAHRIVAVVGLMIGVAGFTIGIGYIGTGTYTTHRGIGIFVISALIFQPLFALIRPHPPTKGQAPTTARFLWQLVHQWNGRILIGVGIANCFVGFDIQTFSAAYIVLFAVLVAVVGAAFLIFEVERSFLGAQLPLSSILNYKAKEAPPMPSAVEMTASA